MKLLFDNQNPQPQLYVEQSEITSHSTKSTSSIDLPDPVQLNGKHPS